MRTVVLCPSLTRRFSELLFSNLIDNIDDPLAKGLLDNKLKFIVNKDVFDRVLEENKTSQDELFNQFISMLIVSRLSFKSNIIETPIESNFLQFYLTDNDSMNDFWVNINSSSFENKTVKDIAINGNCIVNWTQESSDLELNLFISKLLNQTSAINQLMIVERHPSWNECLFIEKLRHKPINKTIIYCCKTAVNSNRTYVDKYFQGACAKVVTKKNLIHERNIWIDGVNLLFDNSFNNISATDFSWTMTVSFNTEMIRSIIKKFSRKFVSHTI